jgi:hypothetical protein
VAARQRAAHCEEWAAARPDIITSPRGAHLLNWGRRPLTARHRTMFERRCPMSFRDPATERVDGGGFVSVRVHRPARRHSLFGGRSRPSSGRDCVRARLWPLASWRPLVCEAPLCPIRKLPSILQALVRSTEDASHAVAAADSSPTNFRYRLAPADVRRPTLVFEKRDISFDARAHARLTGRDGEPRRIDRPN